jgi:hypothetical protein
MHKSNNHNQEDEKESLISNSIHGKKMKAKAINNTVLLLWNFLWIPKEIIYVKFSYSEKATNFWKYLPIF